MEKDTLYPEINVSTITICCNLKSLYEISTIILSEVLKNYLPTTIKKKFFNQVTFLLPVKNINKTINFKYFKNGRIVMTGCKSMKNAKEVCNLFLEEIKKNYEKLLINESALDELEIIDYKIAMINSNFKTNLQFDLYKFQSILPKSSYEPCTYPGINHKYIFHNDCDLKNCDHINFKKCKCTRTTLLIFQSGNIIITGGKTIKHINTVYNYINDIINKNKNEITI
jgi:TATA-box binding protein (TBP) (component of TFIID and TFIIIB)